MASIKTTNFLLTIVALCLIVIAARESLPEARAQTHGPAPNLYGCMPFKDGDQVKCHAVPVQITADGSVKVTVVSR